MKTEFKMTLNNVWMFLLLPLLNLCEAKDRVLTFSGGVVGSSQIQQRINLDEISKFDWQPGQGKVPLSVDEAIKIAVSFKTENFKDDVMNEIHRVQLFSYNVGEKRHWCWLISFYVLRDSDKALSGRGKVVLPVSFSGKVMAVVRNKDNNKPQ